MKITYLYIFTLCYLAHCVYCYWDIGTTTRYPDWRWDEWTPRRGRFRWMRSESDFLRGIFWYYPWHEMEFRRRLYCIAGVTYEMLNLSTALILNRRVLVTAANFLDPYMNDARNLRIWALGRKGEVYTPYRYRVWRVTRIAPKSKNPEHQHGPWGFHSPRNDISVIHTLDQMYVYEKMSIRYAYATRGFISYTTYLKGVSWYGGCGYEYHRHVRENYKIFYTRVYARFFRDCSLVLPKWWGRFFCFNNEIRFPCVQNGGPLMEYQTIIGVGCFEVRVNQLSYLVFTDLKFYVYYIHLYAWIKPGDYYEYAYPHYSIRDYFFGLFDSWNNDPCIPTKNIKNDLYPMGKK